MNIEKTLEDHEKRIVKLENILQKSPIIKNKKMSIKEFILEKKPKNHTDIVLTIAYFLEKYENVSPFNVKDIEVGYYEAREKMPPNINDKIQMLAKNGFIMPFKEKKNNLLAWVLTNRGEKYIENGFKVED